jgi:hypothetical protein
LRCARRLSAINARNSGSSAVVNSAVRYRAVLVVVGESQTSGLVAVEAFAARYLTGRAHIPNRSALSRSSRAVLGDT